MSQSKPPPSSETVRDYRRAIVASDGDAVHDALVERPDRLTMGFPYLVRAARWARTAAARRDARRRAILGTEQEPEGDIPAGIEWDPFERAARSELLRWVLDAMAHLDDADVMVVWAHFSGTSDEEIRDGWLEAGLPGPPPSVDAIRQRRARTLRELREAATKLSEPSRGGAR